MGRILLYIQAVSDAYAASEICHELLRPLLKQIGQFESDKLFVQVALHKRIIRERDAMGFDRGNIKTESGFVRFKSGKNAPMDLPGLATLSPPEGSAWDADMGSPVAMADFIDWACLGNYLDAEDIFIFWGHGGAWNGLLPVDIALPADFVNELKDKGTAVGDTYIAKFQRATARDFASTIELPRGFGPFSGINKSSTAWSGQRFTLSDALIEKLRAANPYLKNFPRGQHVAIRYKGGEDLALPIELPDIFGIKSGRKNSGGKQTSEEGAKGGHRPGLIVFDSCLMANLECCYDLRETGAIVLASVNFLGYSAWPLVDWLTQKPSSNGETAAQALLNLLMQRTRSRFNSASIIHTSKLDPLKTAIDEFCTSAIQNNNPTREQITAARNRVVQFGKMKPTDSHDYAGTVDIGEFFVYLSNAYPDPPHATVVAALAACKACVPIKPYFEPEYRGNPLTGLTIFFPKTRADAEQTYGYGDGRYSKGKTGAATFIRDSSWLDFLQWYWQDKCQVQP